MLPTHQGWLRPLHETGGHYRKTYVLITVQCPLRFLNCVNRENFLPVRVAKEDAHSKSISSRIVCRSGSSFPVFLTCRWVFTHTPRVLDPSSLCKYGRLQCPSRSLNYLSSRYLSSQHHSWRTASNVKIFPPSSTCPSIPAGLAERNLFFDQLVSVRDKEEVLEI